MACRRKAFSLLIAALSALVAAGAPRDLKSFTLGANTHRVFRENSELLAGLGNPSVRIDLLWEEIADAAGVVRPSHRTLRSILALDRRHEAPLVILDYGHSAFEGAGRPTSAESIRGYARYAGSVASYLAARTSYFEVWNEWNIRGVPGGAVGSPAASDYVALLREAHRAIKRWNPRAVVLGGSISGTGIPDGWLEDALRGGLLKYCDGLSFHPYFYGAQGDEVLPEVGLAARVEAVKEKLRRYEPGRETPLYVTELGWPAFTGKSGVTIDEQAKYLARSVLLLALDPRVRGAWLYELRDSGGAADVAEREAHFGFVTATGEPKAAYHVLRDLRAVFAAATSIEAVSIDSLPEARLVRFRLKAGGEAWVGWTIRPGSRVSVVFESGGSLRPKVRQLGRPPMVRKSGDAAQLPFATVSVELDDMPRLIVGGVERGQVRASGAVVRP